MKLISEEVLNVKKIDIINESVEKIKKEEIINENMISDMVKKTVDDTMEYIVKKVTDEILKNDKIIDRVVQTFFNNVDVKLEKRN